MLRALFTTTLSLILFANYFCVLVIKVIYITNIYISISIVRPCSRCVSRNNIPFSNTVFIRTKISFPRCNTLVTYNTFSYIYDGWKLSNHDPYEWQYLKIDLHWSSLKDDSIWSSWYRKSEKDAPWKCVQTRTTFWRLKDHHDAEKMKWMHP